MATEMNFHGCQRRGILTVGLISKTCTGGMLPPSSGSIIRWGCLRTASVLSAKSECRSMSTSSGPQARAHVSFKRTKRKLEVHRLNHGQTVGYSLGQKNLNLGSSVTVCQTIRSRLGFFYKARFQIPMFSNCGEPAKSSISRRRWIRLGNSERTSCKSSSWQLRIAWKVWSSERSIRFSPAFFTKTGIHGCLVLCKPASQGNSLHMQLLKPCTIQTVSAFNVCLPVHQCWYYTPQVCSEPTVNQQWTN